MNKIFTFLLLCSCSLNVFAQDTLTTTLKHLIDEKKYDQIIEQYAPTPGNYSAKSLYHIGLAYYMKADDNNCLRFMNLSIEKDLKDPKPLYIKASTLNYMKNFDEAVKTFQSAIELNPNVGEYYSGLGDAYYNLEKADLAIEAYKKATQQKVPGDRPFTMIAQIYSDQHKTDKALEAFYLARANISKESDSYINALFNIGLFEVMNNNYDKAEMAYLELISISPADYHAYAKLIQVYYAKKEYEKATPYKLKLYEAQKKGLLKDNLKDMFCFDQFKWQNQSIQAYERFEDNSTKIYNKHLFYVLNANDNIEFRIQTEFSPVSVELGGSKYLLCMTKGKTHYTFNIGFNDNFKYDDLKTSVINILENKVKPTASSTASE